MMMNEREMSKRAARRAAKRRRVMRNRCILAGVIFALIAMTIGTIIVINNAKAADAQEKQNEETYIPQHEGMEFVTFHHVVKGGESIGSIVANMIQQYDSDESVDDVVFRVIRDNGIDVNEATYHLQPGDDLYVPMWAHVSHEYE